MRRRPAPAALLPYYTSSQVDTLLGDADAGRHCQDGPGPGRLHNQPNHLGAGGVPFSRRPGHGDGLEHRSRAAQLLHHRSAGQFAETLDSCPPTGQLEFFSQLSPHRTTGFFFAVVGLDDLEIFFLGRIPTLAQARQAGGFYAGQARPGRLLCQAGAAGWRSAKPPYDRMIRMIRMTRRAGV